MNQTGFVCYSCSVLTDLIGLACSLTLYFHLSKKKENVVCVQAIVGHESSIRPSGSWWGVSFFQARFRCGQIQGGNLLCITRRRKKKLWVWTNFWTGEFLTCANRLYETVQILFQIAVLFSRVYTNVCIVLLLELLKTCAVPRVPCKWKADPCKFLSVQKLVRFIRRVSLLHFRCRWVRLAPPMGPWFPLAISEVRVIKAGKSRY